MSDNMAENENFTPEMLADMIDSLMSGGSGHVNVTAEGFSGEIKVSTINSTDCGTGKNACCQPTEKYIDEDED